MLSYIPPHEAFEKCIIFTREKAEGGESLAKVDTAG